MDLFHRSNRALIYACSDLGTFVIYSRNGDDITTDVARGILEPYGDLSKCEVLPVQVQEAMRLPMAVLVEFAKFDPKRDLNSVSFSQSGSHPQTRLFHADFFPQAVRQYDGFCIDAFDVKKKTFMSRADADKEFMDKYDQDRHCIFVGGLPYDANKEEVAEFFSSIGEVVDVNIVTRSYWVGQYPPVSQVLTKGANHSQAMCAPSGLSSSSGLISRTWPSRSW